MMNKPNRKIGILTFTYGDNYGQRLQNLAMQEFLKQYFSEVYTIKQISKAIKFIYRIKYSFIQILKGNYIALKRRKKNFDDFDKSYIRFYNIPIDEITAYNFPKDDFQYFIAGSDQIWSPYSGDVNSTFFLRFADRNQRIALSPSLAAEEIPENKVEKYREFFSGFNHISTREFSGSKLVEKLTGRSVETTVDPTLMFDRQFWKMYENKPDFEIPEDYALCYFLGQSYSKSEKIQEIVQKERLVIIDLLQNNKFLSLGPSEFLYLIRNAKIVFTDSYHGTIFSIIYHVPFVICERISNSLNMNSRFETLFSKLSISERNLMKIDRNEIFNLDFEAITKNILVEQEKFKEYFERCIS